MECLTQQLLKVASNSISSIFFKVKKKVTAPSWVSKFWGYSLCQNSALIMTNGIRNVRRGEDIFDKKILVSSSRPQQSFPCIRQSMNRYHSTWCTTYLHYYFLFFFQVGCTAMLFHTGFCSTTRNWRELYKNLTVLSSVDVYNRTRFNRKN